MGKLILCSGVQAKQPFHLTLTGTLVYSIEELCYYIYQNIYIISEDIFDEKLVIWLREQVNMETISNKLKQLIEHKNSLKDMVVSVLCSADYYTEGEIKNLIQIMDEINHRTPKEKQKIKADNYLKYENYSKAAKEYDILLKGEFSETMTTEEYGDILHNLAVAHIHSSSYMEAALEFREAFSRNHREETLFQYLLALKLAKADKEYETATQNFGEGHALSDFIENQFQSAWEDAEHTQNYAMTVKLPTIKADGKVSEYYQIIEDCLNTWKKNYISEIN